MNTVPIPCTLGPAVSDVERIGGFGLDDSDENDNRLARLLFDMPNGTTRAEIDHMLINRRWDCKPPARNVPRTVCDKLGKNFEKHQEIVEEEDLEA
ncbi:hypothetical protein RB195_023462 [Necator americanus]|uniref:Uncharacterized protein n=1 Tax=Necator americanus TaxID=51031 RepID=A0ABR1EJH6_NECAM